MKLEGKWRASDPISTQKPHLRHVHHTITHCWALIYSGRNPNVTPAHQTLQNTCHDSPEFYWFR